MKGKDRRIDKRKRKRKETLKRNRERKDAKLKFSIHCKEIQASARRHEQVRKQNYYNKQRAIAANYEEEKRPSSLKFWIAVIIIILILSQIANRLGV